MAEGAEPPRQWAETGCRVQLGDPMLTQMYVTGPETARGAVRIGRQGVHREIWRQNGGDKMLREFPPYFFFSEVRSIKKQPCSFTGIHQRLVTFLPFKPCIYSFTRCSSSTGYVLGTVLGTWRFSGEQVKFQGTQEVTS